MNDFAPYRLGALMAAMSLVGWVHTADAALGIQSGQGQVPAIVKVVPDTGAAGLSRDVQQYVAAGKYTLALESLDSLSKTAQARSDRAGEARATAMQGYVLYLRSRGAAGAPAALARELTPARDRLLSALKLARQAGDRGVEGWARLSLGMVYADSGLTEQAVEEFRQSQALSASQQSHAQSAQATLQLARLETDPEERLSLLDSAADRLNEPGVETRARILGLSNVLDQLGQMQRQDLSRQTQSRAQRLGSQTADGILAQAGPAGMIRELALAEAYLSDEALLRGDSTRARESLEKAIRDANDVNAHDIAMRLESRLGQMHASEGDRQQAIQAYRRAAYHVSAIRSDIPIYANGVSTYQDLLEPIYRNLSDLLLQTAGERNDGGDRQQLLKESVQSLEALKQSELEDYFNDRCALDSTKLYSGSDLIGRTPADLPHSPLPSGGRPDLTEQALAQARGDTAILYPVVLPDRLELLLLHNGAIQQRTSPVSSTELSSRAAKLNDILRHGKDYRTASRDLYQWILAPMEAQLKASGVKRIVYIPDSPLRLAPLGVLSPDGHDYTIQHYVITTNSSFQNSLSLDEVKARDVRSALLAGVSKPSAKLLDDTDFPQQFMAPAGNRPALTRRGEVGQTVSADKDMAGNTRNASAVLDRLALPEVEGEIDTIRDHVPQDETLLNEGFTKEHLRAELQSGKHQLAHLSTHSYFGHSADDSFIVAYDEVLKVNEVEDILKPGEGGKANLDLVTFSACQTAQGDDRAPLGFTGLAIRSRARNAIGALWPISDKATREFMHHFYEALEKNGGDKAQAMRESQAAMIASKTYSHPSFWAPFVLIGQW